MGKCELCGAEVEFRHVGGSVVPLHPAGSGCSRARAHLRLLDDRNEAHRTKCPKCPETVFFVRHNGGSVWLDALAPPWPRHACFDTIADPPWVKFVRAKLDEMPGSLRYSGVVRQATRIAASGREPSRIQLVVDTFRFGLERVSIESSSSGAFHVGCVVVVTESRVISAQSESFRIVRERSVEPV